MFFQRKDVKEQKIEELLLENYNRYYRLAYSYVHNEADAADIVQNGAYKAIRNSDSLKNVEYAQTWIYRIMLNEIFQCAKKKQMVSLDELPTEQGQEDHYENCNLLEYLTQRDIQTKNSGVNVRYRGKHRFFKGFNEFIKEKTRRCDNDFEKIERHVFF